MGTQKTKCFGIDGVDAYIVDVEVDISRGLPSFTLVGLPDTSIKESKERVTTALKNSGFRVPASKIVINLAPADMRKSSSVYDLAIAVGLLNASPDTTAQNATFDCDKTAFIGELGLDGTLRRVNGVLPMLLTAVTQGFNRVIIPDGNKTEASFTDGLEIYSAKNLDTVARFLRGEETDIERIKTQTFDEIKSRAKDYAEDMKFVRGQFIAKRAMEIAAAGNHNILLVGPPGSGKSMLAKCLPTILPDLTATESFEITKIHSIAGTLYSGDNDCGIITIRPFRSPHHTASRISLVGGGSRSMPGEISLAHHGVLFLDELAEYPRNCLEVLRQPLEDNKITIARAHATVEYPASFQLIASSNPCACGHYGSRTGKCTCSQSARERYLRRLSGPMLDRIDLHIEVDGVQYDDLVGDSTAEPSSAIKQRVESARKIQRARGQNGDVFTNAKMSASQVKKYCALDGECERILKIAFEKFQLSARAYSRILKVARTIADLDSSENILPEHITEAVGYRTLDRKYNL